MLCISIMENIIKNNRLLLNNYKAIGTKISNAFHFLSCNFYIHYPNYNIIYFNREFNNKNSLYLFCSFLLNFINFEIISKNEITPLSTIAKDKFPFPSVIEAFKIHVRKLRPTLKQKKLFWIVYKYGFVNSFDRIRLILIIRKLEIKLQRLRRKMILKELGIPCDDDDSFIKFLKELINDVIKYISNFTEKNKMLLIYLTILSSLVGVSLFIYSNREVLAECIEEIKKVKKN